MRVAERLMTELTPFGTFLLGAVVGLTFATIVFLLVVVRPQLIEIRDGLEELSGALGNLGGHSDDLEEADERHTTDDDND